MEENELKNIVYKATCPHFEWLESKHFYNGNGHHLAQKVCNLVWDNYVKEKPHLKENEEIEEIADKLYGINAIISALFITEQRVPTIDNMIMINEKLGKIIKDLRELSKGDKK